MTTSPGSKQIVFLADETDADDLDYVGGLLAQRGVQAERGHPRELGFVGDERGLRASRNGADFAPDLVVGWVYEDWLAPGMAQLEMLARAGVGVVNDALTLFRGQNKALMSACLHAAGISHATTWATWPHGLGPTELTEASYPVVGKPALAISGGRTVLSSGAGVVQIGSDRELLSLQAVLDSLGQPLYAQSFVETPEHRSIRVWVFGYRAVAAVALAPGRGEWIAHASSGAHLCERPMDRPLASISEAAARALGAPIAGVDLGEQDGGYVVYEVNTCPTFLPAGAVLGDTVPAALADYLAGELH